MVRRTKIYRGETPVEELQREFKEEIQEILKDAAVKMKCSVEELKCRVDALGGVEVQRMIPDEMIKRENGRLEFKRVKAIQGRHDA